MTKVLLCGANGKMGRVIENCISERENVEVVAGVDLNTTSYADFPIYDDINNCKEEIDVIIDFSHPSVLKSLLEFAKTRQIPTVIASTGYTDEQIATIKETAKDVAIFFTFNMSLGVNLLLDLAKRATAVLGDQFDIEVIEKHHNQKIDAPSGTAIMIANAINEEADNRYHFEYDRHSKRQARKKNEVGIHAIRGGTIVGEHEVIFAGRDELVSLKHSATSKEVFAVGAVNASVFMNGKPAGLYEMADLLSAE